MKGRQRLLVLLLEMGLRLAWVQEQQSRLGMGTVLQHRRQM
jgi:hypothetical protein